MNTNEKNVLYNEMLVRQQNKQPHYFKYAVDGEQRTLKVETYEQDITHTLRHLPLHVIMDFLQISPDRLAAYLEEQQKVLSKVAIDTFYKRWYWRETGDKATFDNANDNFDYHFQIRLTKKQIIRKAKNHQLPVTTLMHIINFFSEENNVVYLKE